jgi:hypothetical protein
MMHPEIAKTLAEQRRRELTRSAAGNGRSHSPSAGPSWLSRLPRWHVSWSRTILSPAGGPDAAGGGYQDRRSRRGSSVVIIISAHR